MTQPTKLYEIRFPYGHIDSVEPYPIATVDADHLQHYIDMYHNDYTNTILLNVDCPEGPLYVKRVE